MSKYSVPMGNPLDMLAEECAEVIKERMKMLRFGPQGTPEWRAAGKLSPAQLLVKELGEVLAVTEILLTEGVISRQELVDAIETKHRRLYELFGRDHDSRVVISILD